MKIRNDFVTNSTSSSFIIAYKAEDDTSGVISSQQNKSILTPDMATF